MALLRAGRAFAPTMPGDAGQEKTSRLAAPFRRLELTLTAGELLPTVIDKLSGTELTDALLGYVRRINLNPDDPALQIGTGKELGEEKSSR